MNKNYLLCGVGGQGTILASKLLSDCALLMGERVHCAETIGMAQRGGSVVSHVRIGENAHSPMISFGGADVIVAFEPSEAVRCLPYLKKDGVVVVSKKDIQPVTATLSSNKYVGEEMIDYLKKNIKNLIVVDGEQACEECGSSKVLNVVLLGAGIGSEMMGISIEDMQTAIINRVPEKFKQMNIKALDIGVKIAKENM